jgi:hypothetical protein
MCNHVFSLYVETNVYHNAKFLFSVHLDVWHRLRLL